MKYKNHLWLADLSDVPQSIYDIGLAFREKAMDNLKYKGNSPTLYVKAFYLGWFGAFRRSELLMEPYPKISVDERKGWPYAHITKLNLKHFVNPTYRCLKCEAEPFPSAKLMRIHINAQHPTQRHNAFKKLGERAVITQNILVETVPEKLMLEYIMDGRLTSVPQVVDFSALGDVAHANKVTMAMEAAFHADLTDGQTIYRDAGIPIHNLRHLRVYDLIVNKGLDDYTVQAYLGWDSRDMIEEYLYIRQMRVDMVQLKKIDQRIEDLRRRNVGAPQLAAQAPF